MATVVADVVVPLSRMMYYALLRVAVAAVAVVVAGGAGVDGRGGGGTACGVRC